MINDKILLEKIRAAKNGVADAESELAKLLKEIEVAPRAEKTTIGEALRNAFRKLRDAREHIGKLEARLSGKDD